MTSEEANVLLGDSLEALIDHRGRTPKKLGGEFSDSGVPVISAKHVRGGQLFLDDVRYVDETLAQKWMPEPLCTGDVLLTSEAPLGETAYLKNQTNLVLGQRLFALRPRPEIFDSRYLYYLLRWWPVRRKIEERATGTTAQGIRQSELRQVNLPWRPIKEQAAVADILGTLDNKVELNRRISETLEAMAQAVFKAWFVDFEPVRAKREGRWNKGQSLPGLPAHLYDLFPGRLVDSELGVIPEGWRRYQYGMNLT